MRKNSFKWKYSSSANLNSRNRMKADLTQLRRSPSRTRRATNHRIVQTTMLPHRLVLSIGFLNIIGASEFDA
jgi:hypothetical protein